MCLAAATNGPSCRTSSNMRMHLAVITLLKRVVPQVEIIARGFPSKTVKSKTWTINKFCPAPGKWHGLVGSMPPMGQAGSYYLLVRYYSGRNQHCFLWSHVDFSNQRSDINWLRLETGQAGNRHTFLHRRLQAFLFPSCVFAFALFHILCSNHITWFIFERGPGSDIPFIIIFCCQTLERRLIVLECGTFTLRNVTHEQELSEHPILRKGHSATKASEGKWGSTTDGSYKEKHLQVHCSPDSSKLYWSVRIGFLDVSTPMTKLLVKMQLSAHC